MEKVVKKHNSDLFSELVKNGIESAETTVEIALEKDKFVVENDGPSMSPDEMQKYLFTLFRSGKNDDKNFGYGFASVFQEKKTTIYSGSTVAILSSWDNIEIQSSQTRQPGTKVVVELKEGSPVHEKQAHSELSGIYTKKRIFYQSELVQTLKRNPLPEDYHQGEGVKVADGFPYHGFELSDSSIYPIKILNTENLVVVVTTIKAMDTERTKLTWDAQSFVEKVYRDIMCEKSKSVEVKAMQPYINEAREFMAGFGLEVLKFIVNVKQPENFSEVYCLSKWVKYLSTYTTVEAPDIYQHLNNWKMKQMYAGMRASNSTMNQVGEKLFGEKPVALFGDLKVGVLFVGGEVYGPATLSMISDVDACQPIEYIKWQKLNRTTKPFIATYKSTDIFDIIKKFTIDYGEKDATETPILKGLKLKPEKRKHIVDNAKTITRKDLSLAIAKQKCSFSKGTPKRASVYNVTELKGIPTIIHKSAEGEKFSFTKTLQEKKFRSWRNTLNLVNDYLGLGFEFIPTMLVTKQNVEAMNVGRHIALNKAIKLPNRKMGRMMIYLVLAIHELLHITIESHAILGSTVEDVMLKLSRTPQFLDDLRSVVD